MTCKDCIHYDVCADTICFECNSNCCDECGIYAYNDGKIIELNICENFKDKSKYIELPCKEGDGIWQIILRSGSPYINYTEAVAFNDEYIINDCNEFLERAEIGETIFFNEESAEEKLEKIKND